jgi:hypothetical protein
VTALSVGAVDYETDAVCSLKMRLHSSTFILEYEGLQSCVLKHLLSYYGIDFIVESLPSQVEKPGSEKPVVMS